MPLSQELNNISIQYLKGVGPARKKLFTNLGVETVEDLLYLFPRRYEDRRQITPLALLRIGEYQTATGQILSVHSRQNWYTHKSVCEISIGDKGGRLYCVWFNQNYMSKYFKAGQKVVVFGKVDMYKDRMQMVSPEYELIGDDEDEDLSVSRIVPIYPLTRGITQRTLRKTIRTCLDKHAKNLKEPLPYPLREKYKLQNLVLSLNNLHFPESLEAQKEAYKRVAFEEFFLFQVSLILRRLSITQKEGRAHAIDDPFVQKFIDSFPFVLTNAQKRVMEEIRRDMQSKSPMHRLLQGDVGSGKTIVAFFGCLAAIRNGHQAALMAPTEILARQHFETIEQFLKTGKWGNIRVALMLSTTKKKDKEALLSEIQNGQIDLVVGTHALIEENVEFKSLSFAVVDEQHKFGVRQRALLSGKGINPDVLIMTATPIPRTLCLTLYGDLDISTIDEMPPGRGEISTLHFLPEKEQEAYALVSRLVKEGQQAYIVYPLVEESMKLDLKAAEAMYKHFQDNEFKDFRLGLVHGQMKTKEAEETMAKFKNREIDILIATTVLEVGLDVPNANVMVIEHAERFGLSQLHQLRGRIGRGKSDATCLLIANPTTEDAQMRIKAILSTRDGFEIAQQDLMIRGPGEFFGRHQHGLNELKIANPATQLDILETARKEAIALTQGDPRLDNGTNRVIKSFIEKRYPTYLSFIRSG